MMKKNNNKVIRTTMAVVAATGLVLATGCGNDTASEQATEVSTEEVAEATTTEEKDEATTEKEGKASTTEEKAEESTEEEKSTETASSRNNSSSNNSSSSKTTTTVAGTNNSSSGSNTNVSSGSNTNSTTTNTTASTPTYSIPQGITDAQLEEYRNSLNATTETTAQNATVSTEAISGGSTTATHTHNWVDVTTTVYHEAEGHYETVCTDPGAVWPLYEVHTLCSHCGFDYDATGTKSGDHVCADGTLASYGDRKVQVGEQVIEPTYEEQWVVDKEAWVETVVTGQRCSSCGATR